MSDRDKLRPKTPGPGVLKQIAPPDPEPESWESQSGGGASATGVTEKPAAGVYESPLTRVDRHAAQTINAANNLLTKVDSLETRVENQGQKLDIVIGVVASLKGDVREEFDANARKNDQIVTMLVDQNARSAKMADDLLQSVLQARERSGMIRLETTTATVEVEKTRALSEIEVEKTGKVTAIAVRKKQWFTALGVIGAIAGSSITTGAFLKWCG